MKNQAYIVWASDNVKQLSDVGEGLSDIDECSIYGGLSFVGYDIFIVSNSYFFIVGNIENTRSASTDFYQQVSRVGLNGDQATCFDELSVGEIG